MRMLQALSPQPCVVLEQVRVLFAIDQVSDHFHIITGQEILKVTDRLRRERFVADLDNVKVQQRLIVVIVAGNGVQDVAQERRPGTPSRYDQTPCRSAACLGRQIRERLARLIGPVLHLAADTVPLIGHHLVDAAWTRRNALSRPCIVRRTGEGHCIFSIIIIVIVWVIVVAVPIITIIKCFANVVVGSRGRRPKRGCHVIRPREPIVRAADQQQDADPAYSTYSDQVQAARHFITSEATHTSPFN